MQKLIVEMIVYTDGASLLTNYVNAGFNQYYWSATQDHENRLCMPGYNFLENDKRNNATFSIQIHQSAPLSAVTDSLT